MPELHWTHVEDPLNVHPVFVAPTTDGMLRIEVSSDWPLRLDPAAVSHFGGTASVVLMLKTAGLFHPVHSARFIENGQAVGTHLPGDASPEDRLAAGRHARDAVIGMVQAYAAAVYTPAGAVPLPRLPSVPVVPTVTEVRVVQFDSAAEGTRELTEAVKAGWALYGEVVVAQMTPTVHRMYQRLVRRGGQ